MRMRSSRRSSTSRILALLLLCLLRANASSSKCSPDCGPNGVCALPQACKGSSCIYKCQCNPGWQDDNSSPCSDASDICTDTITYSPNQANTCFHGGKCEYYTTDDEYHHKEIRCNCQAVAGQLAVYAGYQCEYPVTQVCEEGRNFSSYAFCVNNGTCSKIVPPGQPHPLCNCESGYVGRYCEFNNASRVPPNELAYVDTNFGVDTSASNSSLSGGLKFLITAFVLGSLAVVAGFYLRKRRRATRSNNEATKIPGELEFKIDPPAMSARDGQVIT